MLLRSSLGHDFSLYKKSTITRRVERRMAQHDLEQTADYLRYLKEHPIEVRALFRELLINVTSFFRDPDAFILLKTDILPGLLSGKPVGYTLRVWVAGCATGEEAFSIAMVLRELMDESRQDFKVQMYATDLDDEAIAVARAGLYPPNVAQDVSPDRLRRFFVQEDNQFRVCKAVREMVVFAVHNVIKDPPFTKLDLVSCRNVMIYLEPELQDRLVPALHYALNPGGVLFLSPSESVGSHTELFEPIQRKWKFFRARPGVASSRTRLERHIAAWPTPAARQTPAGPLPTTREAYAADIAKRSLLQSFAPAAVLTDLRGNVLYVHGEVGDYLRTAPGYPTLNIVDMAREGLQVQLREMLGLAAGRGQSTLRREVTLRPEGHPVPVGVGVRVLADPDPTLSLLLVSFEPGSHPAEPPTPKRGTRSMAKSPTKASNEARRILELEHEVTEANDRLRVVQEERLSVTEELKSFNEELQSTNEELQSTNEELETSKEELQSVNEELVTLNAELQIKVEEVTRVQDDMKNLLDNMRIGTIFLDRHLVIRRFTRDAAKVYRLVATDVGRPLADIRTELQEIDLLKEAQGVLDTLVAFEREIGTAGGTWYLARIQPYRTMDNVIDGVVLTFTDITERILALAVRKARDLAEAVIDTVRDPLLVLDSELKVVSANQAYYREFNGGTTTTVGQGLYEIANRQWDLPALHLLLDGKPTSQAPQHRSVSRSIAGAGERPLDIDVRRIGGPGGFTLLTLVNGPPPPPPEAPAPP
jgi:two-component system CheB/CheR fusion protein